MAILWRNEIEVGAQDDDRDVLLVHHANVVLLQAWDLRPRLGEGDAEGRCGGFPCCWILAPGCGQTTFLSHLIHRSGLHDVPRYGRFRVIDLVLRQSVPVAEAVLRGLVGEVIRETKSSELGSWLGFVPARPSAPH